MSALVYKTRHFLGSYYALMVAYRAELFLWMLATSLPLIMMGVWMQAGASGKFEALNAVNIARYFIAAFIVRQITVCWVIYEFEFNVVSGKLSPLLLQPADPSWRYISMHLAEQAARFPFSLGMVVLCFCLYPQALFGNSEEPGWWLPSLWRVLLALVTCYTAFLLRYLMQYTIALFAFWIERVSAIEHLIFLPYLFFSGILFPLDALQHSTSPLLRTVGEWAMWTPFPYMLWFPVRLLVGGEVPIARALLTITAWIIALWLINRWVWRRGLKHYSAMGA